MNSFYDLEKQMTDPRAFVGKYPPTDNNPPPKPPSAPQSFTQRSPSPPLSVDSITEQLQRRVSVVSPVSQRDAVSPVSPDASEQYETYFIPGPRQSHDIRPDSRTSSEAPSLGSRLSPFHAADMPAPLRPSQRNPSTQPPLLRRPSSADEQRSPGPYEPSFSDHPAFRRHVASDRPPALFHGHSRSFQSPQAPQFRHPFQATPSPPVVTGHAARPQDHPTYQQSQASLTDYLDRELPPLPRESPGVHYDSPPSFAAFTSNLQHVSSAPPAALSIPNRDVRPLSDVPMATPTSLYQSSTSSIRRASSLRSLDSGDLPDVADVALFAEALQGLGPSLTDPLPQEPFSATTPRQPHPPPPMTVPSYHPATMPPPFEDPSAWTRSAPATPPRAATPPPAAAPLDAPRNACATVPPPRAIPPPTNRGWNELELNEALLGLPDQSAPPPDDDELPDYATSQREQAERARRAALTRAQELENRWRGSAPFRSR